jgi:transcriptional regulator with GAF, ATPase, and Fis domain
MNNVARVSYLLDLVREEVTGDEISFCGLAEALQELVGFKVLTLLRFDVETFRSVRLFSTEPSYPAGGVKQHRRGSWSEHIVDRKIPFIAATTDDVRTAFPDYAGIEAAGCGSTLSVPVVSGDRTIGTLNLWHTSGFYDPLKAGQVVPFAATLVRACSAP